MIRPDTWIHRMAVEHGMIEPFEAGQVREKTRDGETIRVISYGLSSYGYDLRVADEFKVFTNVYGSVVDPKGFDARSLVDIQGDECIVPPNSFALARSVEYFRIPRNVLTICLGKSTYARCGIIVNVTPFEPEWEGARHPRDLQHHPAPRPHLCERGSRPGDLLRERPGLRDELRRPRRKIPVPEGNHDS